MTELAPLPSSLELVLAAHGRLVDWSKAKPLAIEAMLPFSAVHLPHVSFSGRMPRQITLP